VNGVNSAELAGFLRSRRARVGPAEAGLAPGGRRQTPGLRRAEVALLAGMSVDYYIRLEQGRGPHPSPQVLAALGRVLRLTDDERDYLMRLAGRVEAPAGCAREVPESVRRLVDRLEDVPAMVINASYDVLAWNPMMTALIGDLSAVSFRRRNRLRRIFAVLESGSFAPRGGTLQLARQCVADLRASGRYPDDPDVRSLVDELSARSPRFAELWAAHEIGIQRTVAGKKTVHPVVGELELDLEVLGAPGSDLRLVLHTAAPETPSYRALHRLRACAGTPGAG
jgi:transcriptional regulator with XRE-family HTH domain